MESSLIKKSKEAMDTPIVYLIDDDPLLLDTLSLILENMGFTSEKFGSAVDFLATHSEHQLGHTRGCIVSDIRMPKVNGLEFQKILNQNHCLLPIIFVTGFADVKMAVDAMRHGAFDFIEKPFREHALLERIQNALDFNAQSLENRLSQEHTQALQNTLTEREKQVFNLMILGLQNKVIADKLDISQRTVEVHRSSVMHKMQVKNVAELIKTIQEIDG